MEIAVAAAGPVFCKEKAGGKPYQTFYPVSVIPLQINELQDAFGHVQNSLCGQK